MNESLSCSIAASRALMNHRHFNYIQWATAVKKDPSFAPNDNSVVSNKPEVFSILITHGKDRGFSDPTALFDPAHPDKRFAHVRIHKFAGANPLDTRDLPDEFQFILTLLNEAAPDGLILDIRGNPGGDIVAAEMMLQMLTSNRITPCRFHFARTPMLLALLKHVISAREASARSDAINSAIFEFEHWFTEVSRSLTGHEPLTIGLPLTEERRANDIKRVYKGPVTLLVDARSYSAADIFAAGFQDNDIGLVVGVDPNTGGGGANVWSHRQLRSSLPPDSPLDIQELPADIRMSVAIRRATRVGLNEGTAIEDVGVKADLHTPVMLEDLIEGHSSAVQRCTKYLAGLDDFEMKVTGFEVKLTRVHVTMQWKGIHSANLFLDGVQQAHPIVASASTQTISVKRSRLHTPRHLTVHGLSISGELVKLCRVNLRSQPAPSFVAAGAS
jgi:hypothetical protein